MIASEIATALGGRCSGNSNWICHCPSHPDDKSSLSITEKDGKFLFHCHAGCSQQAVVNALRQRGLWPTSKRKTNIVAKYDYTNKEGKLLFQVVKYDTKDFRQRRPDGNGGWIWNLKGVQRVLYHLPDVEKAVKTGRIIYIPEGEKDVDNLRLKSLDATCNPCGAGKWREEYTKSLKSAKVVILPDNDDPGRKHAQTIAEALYRVGSRVKILELPGLPKKGDISDWFQNGGTPEQLRELVKKTPEWASSNVQINEKKDKDLRIRSLIPGLVHHVREQNRVSYLVNTGGELRIADQFEIDGEKCQPKQDIPFICLGGDIIRKKPVSAEKLLQCTEEYIRKYIELPHEQLYLVIALYVGHTYFLEPHFNVTPILNVFGVKETGKTRCGEVVALIAYRGERCTSPTEATLFRAAQAFKSTLVIDEIKLWGPDGNKPVADLIKSRYKRGMKVSRINLNKKDENQIEYFDVFAPLVLCSTETVPDIVKSRCITIIMQQNVNPDVEQEPDPASAAWLREQWTLQKFSWMNKEIPDFTNTSRRRLREITQPLLRVCKIMDESRIDEVADYVQYLQMMKSDEEGDSTEAEIIRAIYEHGQTMTDRKLTFPSTEITQSLNTNRPEKEQFKQRYITACIKRMGFTPTRCHGGKYGFRYDDQLVAKLMQKYKVGCGENNEG